MSAENKPKKINKLSAYLTAAGAVGVSFVCLAVPAIPIVGAVIAGGLIAVKPERKQVIKNAIREIKSVARDVVQVIKGDMGYLKSWFQRYRKVRTSMRAEKKAAAVPVLPDSAPDKAQDNLKPTAARQDGFNKSADADAAPSIPLSAPELKVQPPAPPAL